MITLRNGLFNTATKRWRLIIAALLCGLIGALLAFTITLFADFYFEPHSPNPSELTTCQVFLLEHLPNKSYNNHLLQWSSPGEPLMLQLWFLAWLQSQKGQRAELVAACAAFVVALSVSAVDQSRQKRKSAT
jgi:hypothetical protein